MKKNQFKIKFTDENLAKPFTKTFTINNSDELVELLARMMIIIDRMKHPSNKIKKVELRFKYEEENGV
jgi:hypothetical protein